MHDVSHLSIIPNIVTAIACLALLTALPAIAQPAPAKNQALNSQLSAGHTLDGYLQNLRSEFRRLDADGNGRIDAADIAKHDAATAARARELLSLSEGKNVITLPEIEVRAQTLFRSVDTDGNGTVSQEELDSHRRRSGDPAATAPPPPAGR
jgi:Ca2+-binding EF-hand superfamily protein